MSTQPSQWFVGRAGQQMGPYTDGQIRQLASGGKLLPTDLIWKEGMAEWVPASRLKGLFPAAAATSPAAPADVAPQAPRAFVATSASPVTVPPAAASPARKPFEKLARPATSASCWYCGVDWTHDYSQCPFCQMLGK